MVIALLFTVLWPEEILLVKTNNHGWKRPKIKEVRRESTMWGVSLLSNALSSGSRYCRGKRNTWSEGGRSWEWVCSSETDPQELTAGAAPAHVQMSNIWQCQYLSISFPWGDSQALHGSRWSGFRRYFPRASEVLPFKVRRSKGHRHHPRRARIRLNSLPRQAVWVSETLPVKSWYVLGYCLFQDGGLDQVICE